MKRFALFLLIIASLMLPFAFGDMKAASIIESIELTGNETLIIEGEDCIINGGLTLGDNSSLTLMNTRISFADVNASYTLSGNSKLIVINSSINWQSANSLRTSQNTSIELVNVEMYAPHEVNNRTYFNTGIGLAGNSIAIVRGSSIGFIRLTENARCNVKNSIIGNFGTQSKGESEFTNCTVDSIILYYEKSRVQINQTITGRHDLLNQSQFVKAGESLYDFRMINSTLLIPPTIIIVDGKLEARDTALDIVYMDGDSAIETKNTKMYALRLLRYCWAIIEDSSIDYFLAMTGDFNIQLKNTTHERIDIYDTIGLNLKTNDAKINQLILEWSTPNTPQNVELHNTEIENLYLTMYSPQPIQCDRVTIGTLRTGMGWGDEPPITITGAIHFKENARINKKKDTPASDESTS